MNNNEKFMLRAIKLSQESIVRNGGPFGCIIVKNSKIIAEGSNQVTRNNDPTAHAEVLAIRKASLILGDWRLVGCTLYTTLEPCAMCAGALVLARIERLVFGAMDPRSGMVGSLENLVSDVRLNHRMTVSSGVLAEESGTLLRDYFKVRRS